MKNGGPAFPVYFPEHEGHEEYCQGGMTLRDYFAGQALMGAIAEGTGRGLGRSRADELAEFAQACADSMLKARGEV